MIYDVRDIPKGEEYKLGIVVSMNKAWHKQCHCGVAFNLSENVNILHLATNEDVEYSTNLEEEHFLCFVKPNLHPVVRDNLNEYLMALKDSVIAGHDDIKYGFLYDEYASLSPNGELILGDNEVGLTCATYLLTLFHSCGIDLVDIHNWPHRSSDDNWFQNMLEFFNGKVTQDHFEKLMQEKGCPRYRPEEVAIASALYDNAPAPTPVIWEHGQHLWKVLYNLAFQRHLEKLQIKIRKLLKH